MTPGQGDPTLYRADTKAAVRSGARSPDGMPGAGHRPWRQN